MAANNTAFRKRAQIAKANRTMFLWIAASSVVVGAAVVVSIFFAQNLFYNQKVISAKNETIKTLRDNNKAIPELEASVRVLDTNAALASVKADPSDQTLQVILDALPADANSLALGASLQTKLLAGIDNLKLTSLGVTPVAGIESIEGDAGDTSTTEGATDSAATPVEFQFTVTSTNKDSLKEVLAKLQRSLRLIDIKTLSIAASESGELTLDVTARSYYVPAKTITLTKEVVPRQ